MKAIFTMGCLLLIGLGRESVWSQPPPPYRSSFWTEGWQRRSPQPPTPYQRNADLLQGNLDAVARQLDQLSTIDASAYVRMQECLQTYLIDLNATLPDYASETVYQQVRNRLISLEDSIRLALSDARRAAFDSPASYPITDTLIGQFVQLHPYTLLFKRPDYRSRVRHALPKGASVRVLATKGVYYRVSWEKKTGYCARQMVYSIKR